MKTLLACLALLVAVQAGVAAAAEPAKAPPAAAPSASGPTTAAAAPTASGPSTAAAAAPTTSAPSTAAAVPAKPDPFDQARLSLRAKKSEYVAKNLVLTPDEAVAFWTLYKKYEADFAKVNDDRVALLKKFTEGGDKVDPKIAESWLESSLQRDVQLAKLRLDYLPQFAKILPPEKVNRFFQIDHALTTLAEAKIATLVSPSAAPLELPPMK